MEKFYEKYAWVLFLLIGIMILVGGVPHMFGVNTDPILVESISGQTIDELKTSNPSFFSLYNFYFSGGGVSDVGFAFFLIMISLFAYRKGEKWAWYSFWAIPLFFTGFLVIFSIRVILESNTSFIS